jgi:hypothetical protein
MFCFLVVSVFALPCRAQQEPHLQPATEATLQAFHTHDIVMLGETHGNKQEYEWLRSLVADPEFLDRVDDIVMEFGNSLYQQKVDRYISGENVPVQDVQGAWLNTVASVGPPSPVYASLYIAVREVNLRRKGKHQVRILCGDPDIDWDQVKQANDILPYLKSRDQSYVKAVKTEVLTKHHKALLIMGAFHFLRHFDKMPGRKEFDIEEQLRAAGANPYLIVSGTNTTGSSEQDQRFTSWPSPVIVSLANNWVGDLPVIPVVTGGHGPPLPGFKLRDAADALLYLGQRDSLSSVEMSPAELADTPYGKEIGRREKLQMELEH